MKQNSVSLLLLSALNLGQFFLSVNIGFQILQYTISAAVSSYYVLVFCLFLVKEQPSRMYRFS